MWPNAYAPILTNTASGVELTAPLTIGALTTASAITQLPGNIGGDSSNPDICIENTTSGWAFCALGDAGCPTATLLNGVGVPPQSFRIVRVAPTTSFVSVILAAGATGGNVRFLRGAGIT